MPKLFEYFGLIVRFYSNEHEPIHVHGVYRDRESRAELVIQNGKVIELRFSPVKGRKPLGTPQERGFRKLVSHFPGRYRAEVGGFLRAAQACGAQDN